jgi:hypothetical protein
MGVMSFRVLHERVPLELPVLDFVAELEPDGSVLVPE